MSRGQLVPDETIVRVFLDRLGQPDARQRRDPRRLPAHSRPRRWPSTMPSPRPAGAVDRAILIDVPADDLVQRMSDRRVCTANGHVYNLAVEPAPASPASLRPRRLASSSSVPDDHDDTIRARMPEQIPPLLEVVEHYRDAGVLQTVDGREPIPEVSRSAHGRPPRPAGLGVADGHPQVAPRDREDAPGRPDRGRGPRPRRVRAEAGRHDRPPRSARRAPHPRGRRGALVQGLRPPRATRSRSACASRSTARSSTASPATG